MRWIARAAIACLWGLAATAAVAEPAASRYGAYARIGAVSEGQQGTFRNGIELGGGVDVHLSPNAALGLGFGYARQGHANLYREFESTSFSLEAHARRFFMESRVRPLAEIGLSYHRFQHHSQYSLAESPYDVRWNAPGAWLGAGAEARLTPTTALRLGIAYHFIAQSIAERGGNAEDYFASGLSVEFRPPQ